MHKGKYSADEALALIIASTRTRKRPVSICELATAIEIATREVGTLDALGDQIGLSTKMLRQFMQVNDLSPEVKKLVDTRKIDSVDAVSHIARLSIPDQEAVAKVLAEGDWDTSDVRAFLELRSSKPDTETMELMSQVQSSKTIHEFAFEFIRRQGISEEEVSNKLSEVIDSGSVKNITFEGTKGTIVFDKHGRDQLRRVAQQRSIPIRDIISNILY